MIKVIERKPKSELTAIDNSTLNPFTEPIAYVNPGEMVDISTWDAYGGTISPKRSFQEACDQGLSGALNPVTGPIYI